MSSVHGTSSAMAGPGTFNYLTSSTQSSPSADATLIYSTKKYPGLGLGLPQGLVKGQRRLRATAPAFAPKREPLRETDEMTESSSSSDSEDETESLSASSVISSASESLPAECTSRLYRLLYGRSSAEARPAVISGDGEAEEVVDTPGAPRIPFPPSPSVQYIQSKGTAEARAGLAVSVLDEVINDLHIDVASWPPFDPFRSPAEEFEQPHFYLPTQLLSPELEMSSAEFVASVQGWTARRKDACL